MTPQQIAEVLRPVFFDDNCNSVECERCNTTLNALVSAMYDKVKHMQEPPF